MQISKLKSLRFGAQLDLPGEKCEHYILQV